MVESVFHQVSNWAKLIAEFKVVVLRECAPPDRRAKCDQPKWVYSFWRREIVRSGWYDPEKESLVVICLDTRRRVKGFNLVALGTLETTQASPREVFRPAIVMASSAIIVAHNHPSGNPEPSKADVQATQQLFLAGELLKIELLDHVIVGRPSKRWPRGYVSLCELGCLKPKSCGLADPTERRMQ